MPPVIKQDGTINNKYVDICLGPYCERNPVMSGFCQGHHLQWKKKRSLSPINIYPKICSFHDCDRPHASRGLCSSHYKQQSNGSDLRTIRRGDRFCEVDGCTNTHHALGFCIPHYQKHYRGTEKGKFNLQNAWARRRFNKANNDSRTVLKKDWDGMVSRYNGRCAYCKEAAWEVKDHVVPLAKGGRHSIGNLLPACTKCNSAKRVMFISEWKLIANKSSLSLEHDKGANQ